MVVGVVLLMFASQLGGTLGYFPPLEACTTPSGTMKVGLHMRYLMEEGHW